VLRGVHAMIPTKPKTKPFATARKYSGKLSEPIYEPIGGLLAELMRPEAEKRAREQQFLKLKALFAWYKIDETGPNAWRSLAIALALVYVPGMQVNEGRPRIVASPLFASWRRSCRRRRAKCLNFRFLERQ
jgi:hypothetical protein